jgi:2-oxoisovalerate dehydrogenase E2 component (dihydrolipoyl transacylase)
MQITVTDVNAQDVSKQATEALAAASGASGASGASEPSDAVKALAEEHEIDLDTIVGTGATGNIVKKDVEEAIKEKEEAAAKE